MVGPGALAGVHRVAPGLIGELLEQRRLVGELAGRVERRRSAQRVRGAAPDRVGAPDVAGAQRVGCLALRALGTLDGELGHDLRVVGAARRCR